MKQIMQSFRPVVYLLIVTLVVTQLPLKALAQEKIVVSTYYPSPYGSYKELEVTEKINLGVTKEGYSGFSVTPAGSGARIYFSGARDVSGTFDNGNSDSMWIGRYNIGDDQSELHINLGDNPQADFDYLAVGSNFGNPGGLDQRALLIRSDGALATGTKNTYEITDNIEDGSILIKGQNAFSAAANHATLYLGDQYHYIRSINGTGVRIGTYHSAGASHPDDALFIEQQHGDVGIAMDPANADPGGTTHKLNVNGGIRWQDNLSEIDGSGNSGIELGIFRLAQGASYLDFHNTAFGSGSSTWGDADDYSARILSQQDSDDDATLALKVHLLSGDETAIYIPAKDPLGANNKYPWVQLRSLDFTNDHFLTGPPQNWLGLALAVLATQLTAAGFAVLLAALVEYIVTGSSIRYKTDVKQIDNPLDKILKLRGVEFTWKKNGKRDTGLIAEEVVKIFPGSAVYEKDDKTVSGYRVNSLIGPLVEAIRAQQNQINAQKDEIKQLREKVNAISKMGLCNER